MVLRWFSRKPDAASIDLQSPAYVDKGHEKFGLAIVGESRYQDALARVVRSATVDRDGRRMVKVIVQREPTNPFDPNAIRIAHPTHGTLGYLSREDAERYNSRIAPFEEAGLTVTCTAALAGGTRDKPNIGAWLNLLWPTKANWDM